LSCGAFGQEVPFSFVTFLLGKQKKSKAEIKRSSLTHNNQFSRYNIFTYLCYYKMVAKAVKKISPPKPETVSSRRPFFFFLQLRKTIPK
jgi:hypothetical protein